MRIVIGVLSLLGGAGTMATEIPDYEVLETIGENTELRQYPPLILAETVVSSAADGPAGNQGFRVLADSQAERKRPATSRNFCKGIQSGRAAPHSKA